MQPITFTFQWLRCDGGGNNCIVQAGLPRTTPYVAPRRATSARRSAPACIARNARGESSRLTAQSPVVQGPQGPAGQITLPNGEKSIPVTSVPSNESLVVDQAVFSPNPSGRRRRRSRSGSR